MTFVNKPTDQYFPRQEPAIGAAYPAVRGVLTPSWQP